MFIGQASRSMGIAWHTWLTPGTTISGAYHSMHLDRSQEDRAGLSTLRGINKTQSTLPMEPVSRTVPTAPVLTRFG